ncbi:hypothetical protein JMA_35780 [Jeotgalibacillus malaysiensis]|uniref:Uncharacterized protein n=1 Tax=Jeotgalibacillus malaysiensis TaxID=1508404 RepID=A0A0B5ARL6_9BACL|nr:hypothetical protein JMA_35780 [Jeotgalibacillus malaysiensis]
MPAVLVETAFLSNPADAWLLRNRPDDFAVAIATEILDYLGLHDGAPVLTKEQEQKLILDERSNIVESFKEFSLLDAVIPSGEFIDGHTFNYPFGPFELNVTFSSRLKTLGSTDTKFTVKDGTIQGAISTQIESFINEFGQKFDLQIEVGSEGIAIHKIINDGEIQATIANDSNNNPVIKVITNMQDIPVQAGLTTSLAIEFELIFDPNFPPMLEELEVAIKNNYENIVKGSVLGALGAGFAAALLTVVLRTKVDAFLFTATELYKVLEEQMREQQPI